MTATHLTVDFKCSVFRLRYWIICSETCILNVAQSSTVVAKGASAIKCHTNLFAVHVSVKAAQAPYVTVSFSSCPLEQTINKIIGTIHKTMLSPLEN